VGGDLILSRAHRQTDVYFASGNVWVETDMVNLPGRGARVLLVVKAFVCRTRILPRFFEIEFIVVPLLAPPPGPSLDLSGSASCSASNMQTCSCTRPFATCAVLTCARLRRRSRTSTA